MTDPKRMQIKADQIKGVHGGSLYDDIDRLIHQTVSSYSSSVQNISDLLLTDPIGTIRFVNNEGRYYELKSSLVNNQEIKTWEPLKDLKIESKILVLNVENDNQTIFNTNLDIGVINGILNIDSVSIIVNGITYVKDICFNALISQNNKLIIEWKSTDFSLDTTDDVQLCYDMLTQ